MTLCVCACRVFSLLGLLTISSNKLNVFVATSEHHIHWKSINLLMTASNHCHVTSVLITIQDTGEECHMHASAPKQTLYSSTHHICTKQTNLHKMTLRSQGGVLLHRNPSTFNFQLFSACIKSSNWIVLQYNSSTAYSVGILQLYYIQLHALNTSIEDSTILNMSIEDPCCSVDSLRYNKGHC